MEREVGAWPCRHIEGNHKISLVGTAGELTPHLSEIEVAGGAAADERLGGEQIFLEDSQLFAGAAQGLLVAHVHRRAELFEVVQGLLVLERSRLTVVFTVVPFDRGGVIVVVQLLVGRAWMAHDASAGGGIG